MNQRFGWSDYYSKHLIALGYEATEIVANSHLQRAWSNHHKIYGDNLLLKQLQYLQPEIVFFEDVGCVIRNLKYIVPSVKLVIGYCCSPLTYDSEDFDLMLTCSKFFPGDYVLPHAFEPIKIDNTEEEDFVFFGSFIRGKNQHDKRIQIVKEIKKLKIYGNKGGYFNSLFSDKYEKPLYGIDMHKQLAKAKIGFNIHGGLPTQACNMRMFETTGLRVCLVTENLPNRYFNEDQIVTYRSADECNEKVTWLLNHPKERKEIALRGQKRTLENHIFEIRAQQLDKIIKAHI
jgi:hypothetical protein